MRPPLQLSCRSPPFRKLHGWGKAVLLCPCWRSWVAARWQCCTPEADRPWGSLTRLIAFKGMPPERPKILHLSLLLAFFFVCFVYFLGDLARSGPSKLSTFHLIELHPYLVAVRSHSTPFAGLVETVPAGPSAFLCDLQLTNRFN